VTQWEVGRSPTSREIMLVGCVATPIPGWVDDMRLTVDARTLALMHTSAERAVGRNLDVRPDGDAFQLRHAGTGQTAGIGRTFIGFDHEAVATCFAICASPDLPNAPDAARGCDAAIAGAHLEGSLPPPSPGWGLAAVTWGVHHPTTAVAWGAALVFVLGVFAVVSRRRPRSRI
jgi:hypothetical protein